MMKQYSIYKTTNKINGKTYIGAHTTYNINDSYLGSGVNLNRAINKYGIENFYKEILFLAKTEDIMYWIERMLVDDSYVKNPNTYNMTLGGFGGFSHINSKDNTGKNNPNYGNGEKVSGNKNGRHHNNFKGDIKNIGEKISKANKGYHTFLNTKTNKKERIKMEDKKEHHIGIQSGMLNCKDKDGNNITIKKVDYDKSIHHMGTTGRCNCYDLFEKKVVSISSTLKDDKRYISSQKKVIVKNEEGYVVKFSRDMTQEDKFISIDYKKIDDYK